MIELTGGHNGNNAIFDPKLDGHGRIIGSSVRGIIRSAIITVPRVHIIIPLIIMVGAVPRCGMSVSVILFGVSASTE